MPQGIDQSHSTKLDDFSVAVAVAVAESFDNRMNPANTGIECEGRQNTGSCQGRARACSKANALFEEAV